MVYFGTFSACGDGIFGTFNACGDGIFWNI